ncbi:hypothetical protein DPMN_107570 [Dreissena polymorpha]|uniref:Uncharacterized protein n=1 Tax=Dreissena polymorpha TaxID=45954 RepID=A0A9D4K773_DREPO|nr:hypothetical protein DPMN_107570 [Dreissena polymorpha]
MAFNKAVELSSTHGGDAAHVTGGLLDINTTEDGCYSTRENDQLLSIDFGANVKINQIQIVPYIFSNIV